MKLSPLFAALALVTPLSASAESFLACPRALNDGNCTSIQSTIDASSEGDVIVVLFGEYRESLVVDHDLEIRGYNVNQFVAEVVGDLTQPVLTVREGATVKITGLHLMQGGGTAGVINEGKLVLHDSLIADSHSEYGAILNQGTLILGTETQVTDNVATGFFGGGLTNIYGQVTIKGGSVFARNSGQRGGGLCNLMGSVELKTSLFQDNHATAAGGAWFNMYPEGTVNAPPRVSYELNTTDGLCARFSDPNQSPSCVD